jgi:tetratricopeptide (TPR) repeat protein
MATLEAWVNERPDDEQVRRMAASAAEAICDWERAAFHWGAVLESGATDDMAHIGYAKASARAGDTASAIPVWTALCEQDPGCTARHLELARVYAAQDKLDEAVTAYANAAATDAGNPTIWLEMGSLFARTSFYEEAISALQQCVSIEPEHAFARALLADAHLQAGDADSATEQARASANCDVSLVLPQVILAEVEWMNGAAQNATDRLDAVLPYAPEGPHTDRARALRQQCLQEGRVAV